MDNNLSIGFYGVQRWVLLIHWFHKLVKCSIGLQGFLEGCQEYLINTLVPVGSVEMSLGIWI